MRFETSIKLDNPTKIYEPGETVTGSVFIDCGDDEITHGVKIEIVGGATVDFTEKEVKKKYFVDEMSSTIRSKKVTRTAAHNAEENYLSFLIHGTDGTVLNKGRTTYPFSYTLPLQIPCSFAAVYGFVRYEVKVTIRRSRNVDCLGYDLESSEEFRVNIASYDLSMRYTSNPVCITKCKTFCCIRCKGGPIKLTFEMDRVGYFPGEYTSFEATVYNSSKTRVNGCKLMIFQRAIYHPNDINKIQTSVRKIAELILTSGLPLRRGDSHNWRDEHLQIPVDVPPSKLGGYCKLIDVDYEVTMEVQFRKSSTLCVTVPIVIGVLPRDG